MDHGLWTKNILSRSMVHCLWSLVLFLLSVSVEARDYPAQGPLPVRTQNPIYLETMNLDPARAQTLPTGTLELRVDSATSNIFERQSNRRFDENLDMELWRINGVATYGLFPGWDVGMELPLLHFKGGFLDSFIQDYHNFFGFPNGGRDKVANGVFNYKMSENGTPRYNVASQDLNIGDVLFFVKNQLVEEGDAVPALAWRFGFKIPTGDSAKGMGSGSPGFGFGLAAEKSYRRLHGYLNANYLVDGGNNALEGLMHSVFFDFSAAGEYSFSKRVSGILQLDGGTPRLKGTGMVTWDGVPMDLTIGIKGDVPWGKFADPFFWQVGFSEDVLAVGPSVDFTVYLSVGVRFDVRGLQLYQGDFFAKN